MAYLPREWGESVMREPRRRTSTQRNVQRYIRENLSQDDLRANANARALRAINQERVAAAEARILHPARTG